MNSLFETGAKLIGIFYLYALISQIPIFFVGQDYVQLLPTALSFLTMIIFSYILIFKTEILSKYVKLNNCSDKIETNHILSDGIILIGIYSFISHFVYSIKLLVQKSGPEMTHYLTKSSNVYTEIFISIFSLCLIFCSKKIVYFIRKF